MLKMKLRDLLTVNLGKLLNLLEPLSNLQNEVKGLVEEKSLLFGGG